MGKGIVPVVAVEGARVGKGITVVVIVTVKGSQVGEGIVVVAEKGVRVGGGIVNVAEAAAAARVKASRPPTGPHLTTSSGLQQESELQGQRLPLLQLHWRSCWWHHSRLLRPPLPNPSDQLNQLEERGLSYSNSASSLGLNMSMTRTTIQWGLY